MSRRWFRTTALLRNTPFPFAAKFSATVQEAVFACCGSYGAGTLVHRWMLGSWQAAKTASASFGPQARSRRGAENGVLDTSRTLTGGSWAALDPATGKIVWQTGDPNGAMDLGAVSTAGGVVFGGSMDGTMYAINGDTGQIEWSFASGGSVNSGAAIVGNNVFWGSGYSHLGLGTGSSKLYMFSTG